MTDNRLKNICNALQVDDTGNVAIRVLSPGTTGASSPDNTQLTNAVTQLHNDLLGIARLLSGLTSNSGFIFTQTVPSAVWNINHSLGFFPIIGLYDESGADITGTVVNIDANNVRIQFSLPTSGTARLI